MRAPDHQGYTVPGETDDLPISLGSKYTEDTIPNPPCTDISEGMSITMKHILEFIDADTENPDVRFAALIVDLGRELSEDGFWRLVDDYTDPMPPKEADAYCAQMRAWLTVNGVTG